MGGWKSKLRIGESCLIFTDEKELDVEWKQDLMERVQNSGWCLKNCGSNWMRKI